MAKSTMQVLGTTSAHPRRTAVRAPTHSGN